MKAHIARNQNAGVPLALGWNLSNADRGKLEGMAPAFGMKLLPVSPADAGKTVAQLLGEVEVKTSRTLVLEPGAYPPALVLANFREKDLDTLLDLMKQAQVNIPLKAVITPSNKNWSSATCWLTCLRSTPPSRLRQRSRHEHQALCFRPAGRDALPEPPCCLRLIPKACGLRRERGCPAVQHHLLRRV